MFLFLVLPILVSGFVCCHLLSSQKYKLYRFDGQYLYLKSATFGILCLLVSTFLALICHKLFPVFPVNIYIFCIKIPSPIALIENLINATNALDDEQQVKQLAWVLVLTVLTLLSPYFFVVLEEFFLRRYFGTNKVKEYVVGVILDDSPLDAALYNALIEETCMMLSLSDSKVYVCKIVSMGEPNEREGPNQEIIIAPIMSGYRDVKTRKVTFVTYYESSDDSMEKEKDGFIIIRQSLISYLCSFDFEVYKRLNKPKKLSDKIKAAVKTI